MKSGLTPATFSAASVLATTRARVNAAQNPGLTRSALLAIVPFDETKNLGSWLDTYQSYPARALKLLLQARPI